MNRSIGLFTGFAVLLLTGCDKDAREFAAKTASMLREYESQLNKQIGESEQYYREYTAVETDSMRRRNINDESVARREIADKWSVDYIEKQKNAARLREQLLDVAKAQFEVSQKRWVTEVDESRIYLEKIEKLQVDKEKVEALGKLLDALTKKRSLLDEGKEITKFVETAKEELDKKICADIDSKLKKTDPAPDADRKAVLEQLKKDRKCATS